MALKKHWNVAATYLSKLLWGSEKSEALEAAVKAYMREFEVTDRAVSEKKVKLILSVFDVDKTDLSSLQALELGRIRDNLSTDKDRELWKFFQGRGDQVKQQLWTTVTWLIAVEGAFLALLFEGEVLQFNNSSCLQFAVCLPVPASILAALGIALSVYSLRVLEDTAKHVNSNWAKAKAIIHQRADSSGFQNTSTYKTTKTALYALLVIFILILELSFLQWASPENATAVGLGICPPAQA